MYMTGTMKKLIFLTALLLVVSCEDSLREMDTLGENAGIVGTWVEEGMEDDVSLFARSSALDSARHGFIIRGDGAFVERANAGWCGTPPISYSNYEGAWVALSDSLLEITVGYYGGAWTYQMRIVLVDEEYLRIRYLFAEDREQAR